VAVKPQPTQIVGSLTSMLIVSSVDSEPSLVFIDHAK